MFTWVLVDVGGMHLNVYIYTASLSYFCSLKQRYSKTDSSLSNDSGVNPSIKGQA